MGHTQDVDRLVVAAIGVNGNSSGPSSTRRALQMRLRRMQLVEDDDAAADLPGSPGRTWTA